MIAAVDVCYSETGATAGGVLFRHWTAERPARELWEFIVPFGEWEKNPRLQAKTMFTCLFRFSRNGPSAKRWDGLRGKHLESC